MSTIAPGELLNVSASADPQTVVEGNFSILTRLLYMHLPTFQNGAPNTTLGSPSEGTRIVGELWRDTFGAEWVCTEEGTPGTWVQIKPAIVDEEPLTTVAGYWIIRRDQNWKHYYYNGSSFVELFLALSGGTMLGALTLSGDPSNDLHAANKGYVDAVAAGVRSLKLPCRVSSTGNVTISSPGAAIDGVTLAEGDRVLLKDQSTAAQNGIYIFNGASSAMTRAGDFDSDSEALAGSLVAVTEGSVGADKLWLLTTDDPITLGTDDLSFALFSASAGDVVGPGSAVDGNLAAYDGTSGNLLKDSGKAVPTGALVGDTDTQTLSNKTLTAPVISTISNGGTVTIPTGTTTLVGKDTTDKLTNKNVITPHNAQTGTTYTPVLSDAGKLITLENASAITLTVPPNSSVAYDVGTTIPLLQKGAGQVTVAPGSGVTVSSRGSVYKIAGQHGMAVLHKIATDTWILSGDITA